MTEHDALCEKIAENLSDLKTEVALARTFTKYNEERITRHKAVFDDQIKQIMSTVTASSAAMNKFQAVTEVVKRHDVWISLRDNSRASLWNALYATLVVSLLTWLVLKINAIMP